MKNFDYKDINLVPKYFNGTSRRNLDTSIRFGNRIFKNPVIPANMKTVINEDLALKLALNDYFYIMHRFDIDYLDFCDFMMSNNQYVSLSVGVNDKDFYEIKKIVDYHKNIDYLTIDIAHGHSRLMKETIEKYRKLLGDKTFIIAGNISTKQGYIDLVSWGADAVKVGIAPGAGCATAMKTGFGSRGMQASVIEEISHGVNKPIIADGGIEEDGDIVKAIALGATMVMVGSHLTGFTDSPGDIKSNDNGDLYYEYYGSASEYNGNKTSFIEGVKKEIPLKNVTMLEGMQYINESLQSAMSYGGCENNILDLWNVEYKIKSA